MHPVFQICSTGISQPLAIKTDHPTQTAFTLLRGSFDLVVAALVLSAFQGAVGVEVVASGPWEVVCLVAMAPMRIHCIGLTTGTSVVHDNRVVRSLPNVTSRM